MSSRVLPLVRAALLATCSALASCSGDSGDAAPADACTPARTTAAALCHFTEYAGNPVLAPPGEPITGDPSVIAPEASPDGRWHLFAWVFAGIVHYASPDGIAWTEVDRPFKIGSVRPYVFRDGGQYHVVFERFSQIAPPQVSHIQIADSPDLVTWSEPVTILEASLDWEKETQSTVGNPYIVARDGEYWLYYSASGVSLPDAGYTEPRYIGLARSGSLRGPYVKEPKPIVSPDPAVPWRNLGSGSLKLLGDRYGGKWVALENGIYKDGAGATHSAIQVIESDDGVSWHDACPSPPLAPTGAGWNKAFVYAFDTVRRGAEVRVYYNARDGWMDGVERIGFSSTTLTCR